MLTALLLGAIMAFVDVIVLSLLQMRHSGAILGNWVFALGFLIYGCQSLIFYYGLSYANLTIMNLMWDLSSDVLLTLIGLTIFKNKLTSQQFVGLVFGFIALLLLK